MPSNSECLQTDTERFFTGMCAYKDLIKKKIITLKKKNSNDKNFSN